MDSPLFYYLSLLELVFLTISVKHHYVNHFSAHFLLCFSLLRSLFLSMLSLSRHRLLSLDLFLSVCLSVFLSLSVFVYLSHSLYFFLIIPLSISPYPSVFLTLTLSLRHSSLPYSARSPSSFRCVSNCCLGLGPVLPRPIGPLKHTRDGGSL